MTLRHWDCVGVGAYSILSEFPVAVLSEVEVLSRDQAFVSGHPTRYLPRSVDKSRFDVFEFPPIVSWVLPVPILAPLVEINVLTSLGHLSHDNFQE